MTAGKAPPPMKWFRLYNEARNDAKLESLPDDEFRVWHRLLCFANEQPVRGLIVGFTLRLLAVEVARGDVALLQRTFTSLQELRIIETSDDACHFINWEKRQFISDNVSNRVMKHREQVKKQGVTLQERYSNGDVTPSETDTETETELVKRDTSRKSVRRAPRVTADKGASAPQARTPTPSQPRNEHWDALVAIFGYQPATKEERNKWGKVVKDLKDAHATVDDIHRAKANYDAALACGAINWTLTPTALASHLGELLSDPANGHNGYAGRNSRPRAAAASGPREPPRFMPTLEDSADAVPVNWRNKPAALNGATNGAATPDGH